MARYKETNERMREETREKILTASLALFAEKGFSATSMRDIANEAKVAVGLTYHYYKNKAEIFDTLKSRATEDFVLVNEFFGKAADPVLAINDFAKEFIEAMGESLELAHYMRVLPCTREYTNIIAAYFGMQKAQYFMASLQGLCEMQLLLKDEFVIPTVEILTAFMNE